jgi:hypothetical protein
LCARVKYLLQHTVRLGAIEFKCFLGGKRSLAAAIAICAMGNTDI